VTRFVAVDELLDLSERTLELQRIEERLENPPMNTVIAMNRVPTQIATTSETSSPNRGG
jgi:hypothetical protein